MSKQSIFSHKSPVYTPGRDLSQGFSFSRRREETTMITSFSLTSPALSTPWKTASMIGKQQARHKTIGSVGVKAFLFNPSDERILKQALSEPVAFLGGMFAGLLRLDLSEDPLKEWVVRTVEASGITEEEIEATDSEPEEIPQQIEIE